MPTNPVNVELLMLAKVSHSACNMAAVDDPAGRLRGNTRQVRWLVLERADDETARDVRELLDLALALRFARRAERWRGDG